jgi:hypothetical protein
VEFNNDSNDPNESTQVIVDTVVDHLMEKMNNIKIN